MFLVSELCFLGFGGPGNLPAVPRGRLVGGKRPIRARLADCHECGPGVGKSPGGPEKAVDTRLELAENGRHVCTGAGALSFETEP